MNEEIKLLLEDASASMNKAIDHLQNELSKLRAGKANPAILDNVLVDYYGSMTPLSQAAGIKTQDAKTLVIQPWEKAMLEPVERAIIAANLGLNPQNDGILIRIVIPPLTEETRRDLVKNIKTIGEQTKVTIRNIRKDANDGIKKMKTDGLSEDEAKDSEQKIQDTTNQFSSKVDKILEIKEQEVMTV